MYDKVANETLDELTMFFEELGDSGLCSSDYDVQFSVSYCYTSLSGMCLLVV